MFEDILLEPAYLGRYGCGMAVRRGLYEGKVGAQSYTGV